MCKVANVLAQGLDNSRRVPDPRLPPGLYGVGSAVFGVCEVTPRLGLLAYVAGPMILASLVLRRDGRP